MEELLAHTHMSSTAVGQLLVEPVRALNARKFRGEECEPPKLLHTELNILWNPIFLWAFPGTDVQRHITHANRLYT